MFQFVIILNSIYKAINCTVIISLIHINVSMIELLNFLQMIQLISILMSCTSWAEKKLYLISQTSLHLVKCFYQLTQIKQNIELSSFVEV